MQLPSGVWLWTEKQTINDEARPLVRVIALCSLQCLDTDGWVAGRTSSR